MSAVLVTGAYCYAELAVSSLAMARPSPVLIAPTHGGMARLSRPGWLVKYQDGIPANGHPSSENELKARRYFWFCTSLLARRYTSAGWRHYHVISPSTTNNKFSISLPAVAHHCNMLISIRNARYLKLTTLASKMYSTLNTCKHVVVRGSRVTYITVFEDNYSYSSLYHYDRKSETQYRPQSFTSAVMEVHHTVFPYL